MTDHAWTGTPVRPHDAARENGAESLPWGGRRERLPLNWPFAEAVEGHRRKALDNPDFDPAATFVWGQMMAVGLVEILLSLEREMGAAGHDLARAALVRVGHRIVSEMVDGVDVPEGLSSAELASLFASWVNEVCYASVENPDVSGDRAGFDIHYCPHEDVYGAFDCRIQRYLVQGMLDAVRERWPHVSFDVAFMSTIPSGAATCRFEMSAVDMSGAGDGAASAWTAYSDQLRDRALTVVDVTHRKP